MPHCPPRNPMKAHRKLLAAEGNLRVVDFGGSPPLTKKQLALALGFSTRWVELRLREGMPFLPTDERGRRMFSLSDVRGWLDTRAKGAVGG